MENGEGRMEKGERQRLAPGISHIHSDKIYLHPIVLEVWHQFHKIKKVMIMKPGTV